MKRRDFIKKSSISALTAWAGHSFLLTACHTEEDMIGEPNRIVEGLFDRPLPLKDFRVGDKNIPAGKYALFTIPGKETWTIILNKNREQHLADDYDQKEDVVRLDVTPQQLENVQERLRYAINQIGNSKGSVDIRWEKIKVSMPLQIE